MMHCTPPKTDGMQQAPVAGAGQVVLLHDVPAPWNVPPWDSQFACVVWKHWVPPNGLETQQAPVTGAGQVIPPQAVPDPWNVPLNCAHSCCVSWTQNPFGRQQAPDEGAGQVVLEHDVPLPWNVPPCISHSDSVVITHCRTPAGLVRQHAPVAGPGHEVPVQVVLFP